MKQATLIPTASPKVTAKVIGILVMVNGNPVVTTPSAKPFEKSGKKQFWMWYNHRSILATLNASGWTAKY